MKKKLLLRKGLSMLTFALLFAPSAGAFTAVTSGNWTSAATWGGVAPGGTVTSADIDIPAGVTVTLDMNVVFTGLAVNSFTVDGTLSSSSANSLTIAQGTFAGTGMVNISSIAFTSVLASLSFTGTLNVNEFRNSGAAILLGATVSVADTLNLDAGTILLNSGSNLTMLTNSTVKVNNGSISISGGIFNSGTNYNAVYVGASKTTGIEINLTTLQDVYIQLTNNTQVLTLGGNPVINGNLHHTKGKLDFTARNLTLKGNLFNGPGVSINSSATSNLTMQGTTPPAQGLVFAAGSSLNNLSINYTGSGSLKLTSAVNVAGNLMLVDGDFSIEVFSTLKMNTGSTILIQAGTLTVNTGTFDGALSYNVHYNGSTYTTGEELSGAGLTNVEINLVSGSAQVTIGDDVTIQGNLDINNGKLSLYGKNLTLNGTLDNSASANIVGSASSDLVLNLTSATNDTLYFDVSNQNIDHLVVNLGAGANLVLGSAVNIYSELNLQSGSVDVTNNNLVLKSTASINNYSDTKYVITSSTGTLQMMVNTGSAYVIFPVGTQTNYSPAAIQQTLSGTSGMFKIRAMNGVYTDGLLGYNSSATTSVVDRTWVIDTVGTVTVNSNLRLGWKAVSEVNGFDRTQSYISHYTASNWDSFAAGNATAGAFSTYETTRTGITSLSPFSVADVNAELSVNTIEPATVFNLYPNPSNNFIYVETISSIDNLKYDLIDVTGKTLISVSAKSNRTFFDVSEFNNGFYFIRITNLKKKEVVTKSFIKG